MELLYGKKFSKDIDDLRKNARTRKALLEVIENFRKAGSLADLKDVRKIEGYQKYYRIKVGEYRLGIKVTKNKAELIRFLHRKDIYNDFHNWPGLLRTRLEPHQPSPLLTAVVKQNCSPAPRTKYPVPEPRALQHQAPRTKHREPRAQNC